MIKTNLLAGRGVEPSLAAFLLAGRTFVPLLLAALAVSASLFPALGAAFELRPELVAMQPWRLLTGHLAHFGETHLWWDLLVFLALAPLLEPRRLASLLLTAGLAISFGVLICHPELAGYRGLSGLDSALFAALALDLTIREGRLDRALGWLALALFAAKTGAELIGGGALFAGGDFVPVPLAHLFGFLAAFGAPRERAAPAPRLCHNAPP